MNLQEVEQKISESSIVVAASEQISSDLGGEAVILNLKSGVYHGLNEVGARIWELIQKPIAVSEIKHTLIQEYEVEASPCINDVLALLDDMFAAGLIEVRNEMAA